MAKLNENISTPVGVLIIVIVAILASGILLWQQQKIQKEETKILEIKPVQKIKNKESGKKTLEENKTANWRTYKSESFAGPYEVKFPATWKLEERLFSSPEKKRDQGIIITHFPSNYSSAQMAMKSKIEAIFIGIGYSIEKNTLCDLIEEEIRKFPKRVFSLESLNILKEIDIESERLHFFSCLRIDKGDYFLRAEIFDPLNKKGYEDLVKQIFSTFKFIQ